MSKGISIEEDIKAIFKLREHIKSVYFDNKSTLSVTDYDNIVAFAEGDAGSISIATIRRIFNLEKVPRKMSYAKLDVLTNWAYNFKYKNFKHYVKNVELESVVPKIMSHETLIFILESINKKEVKKDIVLNNKLTKYSDDSLAKKILEVINLPLGDVLATFSNLPVKENEYYDTRLERRVFYKEQKRQLNLESIGRFAIEDAKTKKSRSRNSFPSQEWIDYFFNISQDCSNETMQFLWGKLLSNEIDKPGSISRRTLSTIKLISSFEADTFTKLCNCIWTMEEHRFGREKILIKDMNDNNEYSDDTWGFNGSFVPHLEEIGLVFDSFIEMTPNKIYSLDFYGNKHQIKTNVKDNQLEIVVLSLVGAEIFEILDTIPNQAYYKKTIGYFNEKGILFK